jgi:hypothetical protein
MIDRHLFDLLSKLSHVNNYIFAKTDDQDCLQKRFLIFLE